MEKEQIISCINKSYLKIIVKPNSHKDEIISYDEAKQAIKVNIKARPEANKANIEVIKFFSKLLKRKVEIVSGLKSREKILRIS